MEVQPGYKTSEYWLVLIKPLVASGIGLAIAYGYLTGAEGEMWTAFVLAAVALGLAFAGIPPEKQYIISRKEIKSNTPSVHVEGIHVTAEVDRG